MLNYVWTFEGNTVVSLAFTLACLAFVLVRAYFEITAR